MRFYVMGEDLDPSDPNDFVDRTFELAGTQRVEANLDLSIGKLQTPVPDDVAVYPILILLNGLADYGGVPLFSLGSRQSRTALAMTTVIR
jgi:hypothetical protein